MQRIENIYIYLTINNFFFYSDDLRLYINPSRGICTIRSFVSNENRLNNIDNPTLIDEYF